MCKPFSAWCGRDCGLACWSCYCCLPSPEIRWLLLLAFKLRQLRTAPNPRRHHAASSAAASSAACRAATCSSVRGARAASRSRASRSRCRSSSLAICQGWAARRCGLSREDEIAIVFCGSKKSLVTGIPMANALFAGASLGLVVLPLMIFHQLQLMACATLARRYARGGPSAEIAPAAMLSEP